MIIKDISRKIILIIIIFAIGNSLFAKTERNKSRIGSIMTIDEINQIIMNNKDKVVFVPGGKGSWEGEVEVEGIGLSFYIFVDPYLNIYNEVGWMHINLDVYWYSADLDIYLWRFSEQTQQYLCCAESNNDIWGEDGDEHLDWNTGPDESYFVQIQWDPDDTSQLTDGVGYVTISWPEEPWFAVWPKSKDMYMQYEDRMTWPFGPQNYDGNYHYHYGIDLFSGYEYDEESKKVYAVYSGYCFEYAAQYDNYGYFLGYKVKIDHQETDLFSPDNNYGTGYLHLQDIPTQHDSLNDKWLETGQYLTKVAWDVPNMGPHLHFSRFNTINFFWNECGHTLKFFGDAWQYESADFEIQGLEYNDNTNELSFYSWADSYYFAGQSVCDLNKIEFISNSNGLETIINIDFDEFENCPTIDDNGYFYNLMDIYENQTEWNLYIDVSEDGYTPDGEGEQKHKWIFQYTGSTRDEFSSFTVELFNIKDESQDIETITRTGTIEGMVTLIGGSGNVEDVNVTAGDVTVHPNSLGNYSMELGIGTYDVTASLEGYTSQTIENVEVLLNQITPNINFDLESSIIIPPGNVSGIWELGIYYVEGDITIPNGETLTIHPGATVTFTGEYIFDVQGTLIAEGDADNMIKFTVTPGNEDIGWNGLSFNCTPAGNSSSLQYCKIEYGISDGPYKDDKYPPDPLLNGGGIFVKDYDNLIIENCIIQNNHANHGGGGIYLYNSNITIQNCIIKDNTADPNPYPYPYEKGGGGIHCELSSPEIINCVIDNNYCSVGGGVCLYNLSYPTFKYNLISNNYGAEGGAIFFKDSSPAIINSTISYNDAYLGVIYCKSNSDPTFKNCILWDNIGYEVHLYNEDSDPNFYYCDIEGGLGSIYGPYVTYTGNYENNIDENPLFVDPNNEDFHLTADSPCIDAGDPSSPPDPDETIVDMGTYYFHQIGIIKGNVSLSGGNGNVEDVEVTAGGITVNPDGSGYYYIELYVGTYDVRASLPAYNFPTANGIVVENGTTTTVNLNLLYTGIIFVSQDEDWHFTTIQDGIGAAQNGEKVYVDDGTYNDEIELNGRCIIVRSIYGPTNCIIDSYSSWIGVIFFSGDNSTFEGFTITESLIIEQSSPIINNCKMNNSYYWESIYIEDGSSPVITNCECGCIESSNSSLEISNCQINGEGAEYGISSMQSCSTIITNCEITNCQTALGISGGSTIIDGCIISNNVVWSGGVPIIHIHESLTTFSNCEIVNNIVCGAFCESKTIYCTGSTELYLSNCTLSGNDTECNDYSIYLDDGAIGTITNCILWDDVTEVQIYPCADVSYCDIKTDYPGYYPDNCIFDDPNFFDPANGNYSLAWNDTVRSPCIDTGDPDTEWDADNTPPDMGAITAISHDYFYDQYDGCELDQIDWISFPVLNRLTENYTEALGLLNRQELLNFNTTQSDDILDHVVYEYEEQIYFYNGSWINELQPDEDFHSYQGYKIVLQEGYTSADIGISGTWEDESEPIQLYSNKLNWVGCYLEEPATLRDAFDSIWDEWISITSEHWGICRDWEEEQIRGTVNPGELYIITVNNDCELIWNESSPPVPPYRKEMTDYFAYEEKLDYMPILVDTVYGDTTVTEIGVYYEDECIGASKVTDGYPVQILAYTPESGSKDGGNGLQFMLYYGSSKNKAKVVTNYTVFNKETSAFVNKPVYYDRDDFVRVRLNTEGHQPEYEFALMNNYPNPVNTGMTNISFAPVKDAINTEIQIFNIKGQLVRKLDCNEVACKNGGYTISWDCRNENGIKVSSGIYFYKLTSDNKTAIKKMLVIR